MARPTSVTVVADTGALYALIDRSDDWYEAVRGWWKDRTSPVVVPVTVLPELCYLLQARIGGRAERSFISAVAAGEFTIEQIESEDYSRIATLTESYSDLPLGFTDASIIAVAERLGTRDVLTTDRRHFGVVRPAHVRGLRLLP